MKYTTFTGYQAYAHMHTWQLNHRNGFAGHCHKTCQDAWGLPVMYASAIDAWNHIPAQHRHTNLDTAPIGAPVFFSGGQYGHVALMSDKKGILISTDAPTRDYIGEVPVSYFTKKWGKTLLGWASMYNGEMLNFHSTTAVMPK